MCWFSTSRTPLLSWLILVVFLEVLQRCVVVVHPLQSPPGCLREIDYRLCGQSLGYSRQVIEHRVIRRYCPHCQRWQTPRLDLTGQVLGQGRFGVRLVSLIATLRAALRMTLEQVRGYLQMFHKLSQTSPRRIYDRRRRAESALGHCPFPSLLANLSRPERSLPSCAENGARGLGLPRPPRNSFTPTLSCYFRELACSKRQPALYYNTGN